MCILDCLLVSATIFYMNKAKIWMGVVTSLHIQLGEAELERLVRGWRRGAGSWFQRRGGAYWKERPTLDPWTIHLLMCCWDENEQWVLTDWQRSTRKETIQFCMHSGKSSWDTCSLAKSTGDRQRQKHGKSLSLNTWHNHSSRALW